MLSVDAALARVMGAARRLPPRRLPLEQALGMVLAQDVHAGLDMPRWDNSAMDGFALRSQDLSGDSVVLEVLETVGAGRMPSLPVVPGTCTRIMTGAPLPEGADCVVMVERSSAEGPGHVRLQGPARAGQHVRRRGEDVPSGALVMRAGCALGAAELGVLAALGQASVMVYRRPRVAILSTGDEVVEPGSPLGPGQIYSSNTATLSALVLEAGAEPIHCGLAPDDLEGLRAALLRARGADMVLSTGGVSVGEFDLLHKVLGPMGVQVQFHKVAMQPGKPVLFGLWGEVPYFGLPGNPVSCMVGFWEFARPLLRCMMGHSRPYLPVMAARAASPVRKEPGRALFVRVSLRCDPEGVLWASPVALQSSGAMGAMLATDALLMLPEASAGVSAGEPVRAQILRWTWTEREQASLWSEQAAEREPSSGPEEEPPCC